MEDQEIRSKIQQLAVDKEIQITSIRSISKEFRKEYGKNPQSCKVEHLSKGSALKIKLKCPKCTYIREIVYNSCFRNNFKGLCISCSGRNNTNNFTGQKFYRLKVLKDSGKRNSHRSIIWICECDCGNIIEVRSDSLSSGVTKSCGCLLKESSSKNITKYNRSKDRRISSDYTQEENDAYQEETKTFYNSKEWRAKRKEIIERDKHCKLCGATNNLVVHHIYDRKLYPEYEFDNTKLITLCSSCHSSYHSQAKNITETSFTVFIITK